MKLHFKADPVTRLFAHSKAASARKATLEQLFDGRFRHDGTTIDLSTRPTPAWPSAADIDPRTIPPGLWLIGDQGLYLMSNGTPSLLVGTGCDRHVVAYALEADPALHPHTWRDVKDQAFGGDDGVMFLDCAFMHCVLHHECYGLVSIELTPQFARPVVPDRSRTLA